MTTASVTTCLGVLFLLSCWTCLSRGSVILLTPKVLVDNVSHSASVFLTNKGSAGPGELLIYYQYSDKDPWLILHEISIQKSFVTFNITAPADNPDNSPFMKMKFEYSDKKNQLNYTVDNVALLKGDAVQLPLVELSKPVYKPEENVQFRVLFVNAWNGQLGRKSIEYVRIQTPDGQVRQQWTNVEWLQALQGFNYSLGRDPQEGNWMVAIPSKNMPFLVQKYVLPKFTASIEPPESMLASAEFMNFKVCAKYSTGRPIKAIVKATVCVQNWGDNAACHSVPENGELDGLQQCVPMMMATEKLKQQYGMRDITINVTVEEDGTGSIAQAQVSCGTFVEKLYKISIEALSPVRMGLPMYYRVSVKKFNGQPHPEAQVKCQISGLITEELFGPISLDAQGEYYHKTKAISSKEKSEYSIQSVVDMACSSVETPSRKKAPTRMGRSYDIIDNDYRDQHSANLQYSLGDSSFLIEPFEFVRSEISYDDLCLHGNLKLTLISNVPMKNANVFLQLFNRGIHLSTSHFEALKWMAREDLFTREISVKVAPEHYYPLKILVYIITKEGNLLSDVMNVRAFQYCFESEKYAAIAFSWNNGIVEAAPGSELKANFKTSDKTKQCALRVSDVSLRQFGNFGNTELSDLFSSTTTFHDYVRLFFSKQDTRPDPVLNLLKDACPHIGYVDYSANDMETMNVVELMGMNGLNLISNKAVIPNNSCRENIYYLRKFPMMAMQEKDAVFLADASGPKEGAGNEAPAPRVRSYFPEAWIFQFFDTRPPPQLKFTTPDTMTTWESNFYCLTEDLGFQVAPSTKLTTFKKFYIQATLPYSAKRGETIRIPVKVFNYYPYKYEVTLSAATAGGAVLTSRESIVGCIEAYGQSVWYFFVQASQVGKANFTVTAQTKVSTFCLDQRNGEAADTVVDSDAFKVDILIEPEGIPRMSSDGNIVCVDANVSTNVKVLQMDLNVPLNALAVPQSERAYVMWSGNIMGPALDNLDSLVRMPYGCGEQNMISMVPSLYVLDYLSSLASKESEKLIEKAKYFVETGYQRELEYRHPDGSFSAFGTSDSHGSTWLTAFVLRSFVHATKYLGSGVVNRTVVEEAFSYLLSMQDAQTGCFKEQGTVIHRDMRGSGSTDVGMAAYILITLLETQKLSDRQVIDLTYQCLKQSDVQLYDTANLAMLAYAVSLDSGDSPEGFQSQIFSSLLARQKVTSSKGQSEIDQAYWSREDGVGSVEVTGYALLALLNTVSTTETLKVVRWLSQSRNPEGGWDSTQDTVVGLKALATVAQRFLKASINVNVEVSSANSTFESQVTDENRIVTWKKAVNASGFVEFRISGSGCVLVQVNVLYNEVNSSSEQKKKSDFDLKVRPISAKANDNSDKRLVSTCVTYRGQNASNMVLLRLSQPTGMRFSPLTASLPGVRLVEIDEGNKAEFSTPEMNIYFDPMQSGSHFCLDVEMTEITAIDDMKPSLARVVDYYQPENSHEVLYSLLPKGSKQPSNGSIDPIIFDSLPPRKCFFSNEKSTMTWVELLKILMAVCSSEYRLMYLQVQSLRVHEINFDGNGSITAYQLSSMNESLQQLKCFQNTDQHDLFLITPQSKGGELLITEYSVIMPVEVALRYLRPSLQRMCLNQAYIHASIQRVRDGVTARSKQDQAPSNCPICLTEFDKNFHKQTICKYLVHKRVTYDTSQKKWQFNQKYSKIEFIIPAKCTCGIKNFKPRVAIFVKGGNQLFEGLNSTKQFTADKRIFVVELDQWNAFCSK